jgi:general stress protein 26
MEPERKPDMPDVDPVTPPPKAVQRMDSDYDPDPNPTMPEELAPLVRGTRAHGLGLIRELIQGIRVAMLLTRTEAGRSASRPMATQQQDFDGDLWFFTSRSSPKMTQIARDPLVQLIYSDPTHQRYVSVDGMAAVVDDAQKKSELWSDAYRVWFEKGVDDPDLALVRVSVSSADYWTSRGGPLRALIAGIKGLTFHGNEDLSDRGTVLLPPTTDA